MEKEKFPKKENPLGKMGEDFARQGVRVLRMPATPTQTDLDLEGFDAQPPQMTFQVKRRLRDFADLADKFLAGSVITDSFNDHGQRRMWRQEMSKKYGQAFSHISEQNILRGNNLAGIYSWLDMITRSLDLFSVHNDRAAKLRELGTQVPDISDYDSHSAEEKVEIAKEYERICREYLKVLGR